MYKMMSFYKNLVGIDRRNFLVDIFYLSRFSPGRYFLFLVIVLVFSLFVSFSLFFFVSLFIFLWYILYFVLVLVFILKWKNKHLNTKRL